MTQHNRSTYYSLNPRFFVAVDCIILSVIDHRLSLLLAKRRFEPEKGKWSLMGGFIQDGESADDAARRVLRQLTGLSDVYMEQVHAFGATDRDPGERVISIAYCALLGPGEYDPSLLHDHGAQWVDITHLPELSFDHPAMVETALEKIRAKVQREPIGFNLLPELFTLTQLQTIHEAILGETIDKRNFRKRVAEMDCIEATDQIDKAHSRRGARLYRFNRGVYAQTEKLKF